MYRAFRYRFYPSPSQEVLLRKTMGCSRFVYNHFLALRIQEWTTNQKTVSYNETSSLLTQLKKEESANWLNDVSSVALQQSLQNLQEAYNNFFRGLKKKQKVGFPRFKKKSNRNSITLTKAGFTYKNGEVFIATDRGLISWKGDATDSGDSFKKVYVWPNPVRETYQGTINIDGLTAESSVKITDIAGNLVYKTSSNGGRATWDGKRRNGERVSTGVYLIFCSDSDGNQSRVLKLLFIH